MIPWRFYWILPEYSWNVLSALILFLLVWIQFVVSGLTCSWKSCDFAAEVIELCGHLTLTPTFSFSSTFSVQVHCKKKNPLLQFHIQNIQFSCIKEKKKIWQNDFDDRISWEYPVNQASAGHSAVLKPAGKSRCEPSNFTYSSSEVNETPAVLCLSLLALIEATQFCLSWCLRYDTLNIVFYCEQRDKFNLDEKKR